MNVSIQNNDEVMEEQKVQSFEKMQNVNIVMNKVEYEVELKNFLHRVRLVLVQSFLGSCDKELRQGKSIGSLHRKRHKDPHESGQLSLQTVSDREKAEFNHYLQCDSAICPQWNHDWQTLLDS